MEPHSHPEYEQTFSRIATILDVMAQEQLAQERSLSRLTEALEEYGRRGAETERALREFIAHGRERDAETTDKLNAVIELMDRHLREHSGEK